MFVISLYVYRNLDTAAKVTYFRMRQLCKIYETEVIPTRNYFTMYARSAFIVLVLVGLGTAVPVGSPDVKKGPGPGERFILL